MNVFVQPENDSLLAIATLAFSSRSVGTKHVRRQRRESRLLDGEVLANRADPGLDAPGVI
ncbi:hypothetical protein Lfu02_77300 [Longispora fulva]|nr:hypothetical protein Lfu02_77300 [Longispora fulva]